MINQRYVIGVDIGTSSTKAVLFSSWGQEISKCSITYRLYSTAPGMAEQDPNEILAAVIKAIRQVVKANVLQPQELLCLAFSAAMHSLIVVDDRGQLLTRCITWADNRSAQWAEKIQRLQQRQQLYQQTGTPIHPMSPLVKIVWLQHEYPRVFEQAAKFISIKEFVFYQLFNRFVVDYSIASATGLFNLETLEWDTNALQVANIKDTQLSEPLPTTAVLQPMRSELAAAMGVISTTPVVIGANDGVLSNLGLGAIASGVGAMTIGTSGAVRIVVPNPVTDPHERVFCSVLSHNYWVVGGAVNNGGIILQWLRDQLAIEANYEALMAIAETVPAGASGLFFHPYLLGERAPLWQADARGSFFGLTINHTKAHLVRAVLEGIAFNFCMVFQVLQTLVGNIQTIRAGGGFAASPLWRQIIADIFNQEIVIPDQRESSSLGAAILGLYALNLIDSLETSCNMIGEMDRHQPVKGNVDIYQRVLPVYERLVNRFQVEYAQIAQLQRDLVGNSPYTIQPSKESLDRG